MPTRKSHRDLVQRAHTLSEVRARKELESVSLIPVGDDPMCLNEQIESISCDSSVSALEFCNHTAARFWPGLVVCCIRSTTVSP